MIPGYWGRGEAQWPRKHFSDFQAFDLEALELAAEKLASKRSYDKVFTELELQFRAANDNQHKIFDQVHTILVNPDLTTMLRCWVDCDRDMVRTKLSYRQE